MKLCAHEYECILYFFAAIVASRDTFQSSIMIGFGTREMVRRWIRGGFESSEPGGTRMSRFGLNVTVTPYLYVIF